MTPFSARGLNGLIFRDSDKNSQSLSDDYIKSRANVNYQNKNAFYLNSNLAVKIITTSKLVIKARHKKQEKPDLSRTTEWIFF